MRPVRDISGEENFRLERKGPFDVIRRDSIEPEPVGTIVLKVFRIVGYDKDCDGSLMARLVNIDADGCETGWAVKSIGIDHDTTIVARAQEVLDLFGR